MSRGGGGAWGLISFCQKGDEFGPSLPRPYQTVCLLKCLCQVKFTEQFRVALANCRSSHAWAVSGVPSCEG